MKQHPDKNEFITRKIPLALFISLLKEIYIKTGAEFIDLRSELNISKQQDKIFAIVRDEYLEKEEEEEKTLNILDVPEVPANFLSKSSLKDILNNI